MSGPAHLSGSNMHTNEKTAATQVGGGGVGEAVWKANEVAGEITAYRIEPEGLVRLPPPAFQSLGNPPRSKCSPTSSCCEKVGVGISHVFRNRLVDSFSFRCSYLKTIGTAHSLIRMRSSASSPSNRGGGRQNSIGTLWVCMVCVELSLVLSRLVTK